MQNNSGKKTFIAGIGGVIANTLLKLASGAVVSNTVTETDNPIGVALGHADAGVDVAVELINTAGTVELTASGAITADADVYADDAGKIQALPAAAGTYRKIGIALEAASGDGSIIEVLPYDFHATTTVS